MKKHIPHSRPSLGRTELLAAARVIKSGMLSGGGEVPAFEAQAVRFFGLKAAAAVSSGTKALELSLRAMGVGAGKEAIIPSFVCSALWHAVKRTGADPVPVDCDPETFNLCPAAAKKRLSRKTAAHIAPHMFGLPADIKGLINLGVPVIEDCAQAAGARYEGELCGSFGTACALSFYPTKLISSGGGMALSDSGRLINGVKDLREYDGKRPDHARENARMGEIEAALGRAQLGRLPGFLKRRAEIAAVYDETFKELDCSLPVRSPGRIYYRYVLRVGKGKLASALNRLEKLGIRAARPVFRPLHLDVPCRGSFPGAGLAWETALSLPIYPALSRSGLSRVIAGVRAALRRH